MLKDIFSKNGWRVFWIVYLLNLVENIILLVIFNIEITKNAIITAGGFSLIVTLLVDRWILKNI